MTGARGAHQSSPRADALVLGGIDLVTPLGWAGVSSAVMIDPGDTARHSRYVTDVLPAVDHWHEQERLVERLLDWARRHERTRGLSCPPALYYQFDGFLLTVSRYRDDLASAFRFVLADRDLIEDLADKGRFAGLGERLDLPVPPSRLLTAQTGARPVRELRFPLVLKPVNRLGDGPLQRLGMTGKVLRVDSAAEVDELWPTLRDAGVDVLAQETIAGPETRLESYHTYVDSDGAVVADFTGVKIRTLPPEMGHSTALRITAAADVRAEGRAAVRKMGLTGVAKLDYKRDGEGRLWLLEVNPRFTLWHHLAAAADHNVLALVHADLTGRPRPTLLPARVGATWCDPLEDRKAAVQSGVKLGPWLLGVLQSSARSGANCDDVAPFLRGQVWPKLTRRARRAVRGRGRARAGG